ncbi:MAG: 3-oxoacyl-ACP synthase, partial [Alteraurantiacibacter sp.]|nr:3-oxoacyl-ACP synthase [Alteraurantiacibacter sp.]
MTRSVFLGAGSALPQRCVTNHELAQTVDTSDEWIRERTGIGQRYFAGEGETTSTLATAAARAALENAGVTIGEIDLIVLATCTPDLTFPSTATIVQHALGGAGFPAFDVAAVCSGFLYALSTADAMIRSGQARKVLVIGAETL